MEDGDGGRSFPQGERELVITPLSKDARIPLVRYNTGDTGRLLPYRRVEEMPRELGYEKYLPPLKLPFVSISGRGKSIKTRDAEVFPEEVKEGIYSHFEVARSTTANFKLREEDIRDPLGGPT